MNFDLNTERLFLRQPTMDDLYELFLLMSDQKLTRFLSWEPHTNKDITKNVIRGLMEAQKNDKGYHWCICLHDEIIGLVSLIDVKRNIRTWTIDRAELSYWIATPHQGKGFATEACRSIIEYGFNYLKLHKIIIAHATENIQSQSICRKLDFVKYAHEHDAFNKSDIWHDLIWYEIIKKIE